MTSADANVWLEMRGRGARAHLVAMLPDGGEWVVGRGDIADPKKRSAFAKALSQKFPAVDFDTALARVDRLATDLTPPPPPQREAVDGLEDQEQYHVTDGCTFWRKTTAESCADVLLANFTAKIASERRLDDGVETRVEFEIVAKLGGRESTVTVPARNFASLNWVSEVLGAGAIVEPGQGLRERLRHAIQKLGRDQLRSETLYTHTGWRKLEGHGWCYLHGGGPLGPLGPVCGGGVSLPGSLARYVLPPKGDAASVLTATRAVLDLFTTLPPRIAFAMVSTVVRAVIGGADFSLFLVGSTGAFKSELAALMQQFFGPEMVATKLPASWTATANSLEVLGFLTKDAILTIDDFAPHGSRQDVQRYYRDADRVLRAQGNHSARSRLSSDATLKESKPPRGLYVVTGEDLPPGTSLLARTFIVEIEKGEVSSESLSKCQAAAADGQYARFLAALLEYMAGRLDELQSRHKERVRAIRQSSAQVGGHRRTATTVAELTSAFELFLEFVGTVPGALAAEDAEKLRRQCAEQLDATAKTQAEHQASYDPVTNVLDLLTSALGAGEAHLQSSTDEPLPEALRAACGWREVDGPGDTRVWHPKGACIGWVHDDELWLDMHAALKAAQSVASDASRITVTPSRLAKHLNSRGLLLSTDSGKGHLSVRRTIHGARRRVHRLALGSLVEAVQPGHAVQDWTGGHPSGPSHGPVCFDEIESGPQSGPLEQASDGAAQGHAVGSGPSGPLGPLSDTGSGQEHTDRTDGVA